MASKQMCLITAFTLKMNFLLFRFAQHFFYSFTMAWSVLQVFADGMASSMKTSNCNLLKTKQSQGHFGCTTVYVFTTNFTLKLPTTTHQTVMGCTRDWRLPAGKDTYRSSNLHDWVLPIQFHSDCKQHPLNNRSLLGNMHSSLVTRVY